MRTKILLAIATLITSGTVSAQEVRPDRCPLADQIRSAGLEKNITEQDSDGLWAVARMKASYGTKAEWTFVVGKIAAGGPDDAFNKATASLGSLQFLNGPQYFPQISRWVCKYSTTAGYAAVAVTPVLQGIGSFSAIK